MRVNMIHFEAFFNFTKTDVLELYDILIVNLCFCQKERYHSLEILKKL